MVVESLYKIKSMDARFKKINVANDMTKKQREECRGQRKNRTSRRTVFTKSEDPRAVMNYKDKKNALIAITVAVKFN